MSCFIADTCLNLDNIIRRITANKKITNIQDFLTNLNNIASNIQKLILYKKANTVKSGYYVEDKASVERRLALNNIKELEKSHYVFETFLKVVYILLAVSALVILVFFSDHKKPKNYVIFLLAILLPLSTTLYNKLNV